MFAWETVKDNNLVSKMEGLPWGQLRDMLTQLSARRYRRKLTLQLEFGYLPTRNIKPGLILAESVGNELFAVAYRELFPLWGSNTVALKRREQGQVVSENIFCAHDVTDLITIYQLNIWG